MPTPIVAGDLVIVTGGYPPGGRPIYAIRPGGTGELGAKALAWRTDRGAPYTGTPLLYDGILYACTDNGILSAYEPDDRRADLPAAGRRRPPAASAPRRSPPPAALYLASEDGDVFVVRAGRTFELLATNRMGETLMATPGDLRQHADRQDADAAGGDRIMIGGIAQGGSCSSLLRLSVATLSAQAPACLARGSLAAVSRLAAASGTSEATLPAR